jgi:hypothetical protein
MVFSCEIKEIYLYTRPGWISKYSFVNVSDAAESFNMYGKVPDVRNVVFNIWRDYEEIRISDVSFYLRLNHSRLVTSKFKWRPEIKTEIMVYLFTY